MPFASLILDVDSTLCGIEGIDFLAARRAPAVAVEIARLTERAMDGAITLDEIYGTRLALVCPGADDLRALAHAYAESLAPGAESAIRTLRGRGVRLALVSGGIHQAIWPVARSLGFAEDDVHAVRLLFDEAGAYAGYEPSPLATQPGKIEVARALLAAGRLARPVLAAGDGATDLAMRPALDAFAAFVGFARREPVVRGADHVVESFAELVEVVLG